MGALLEKKKLREQAVTVSAICCVLFQVLAWGGEASVELIFDEWHRCFLFCFISQWLLVDICYIILMALHLLLRRSSSKFV